MLRRALISSVMVVGLATAAPAQTISAVAEQEARQVSDELVKKFETFYNEGNPAGIAALFTADASYATPAGVLLSGRQALESAFSNRIKTGWTKETIKIREAHAFGDTIWGLGEYTLIGSRLIAGQRLTGYFAQVLVRDGDTWRIRMLIANLTPEADVTGMATP